MAVLLTESVRVRLVSNPQLREVSERYVEPAVAVVRKTREKARLEALERLLLDVLRYHEAHHTLDDLLEAGKGHVHAAWPSLSPSPLAQSNDSRPGDVHTALDLVDDMAEFWLSRPELRGIKSLRGAQEAIRSARQRVVAALVLGFQRLTEIQALDTIVSSAVEKAALAEAKASAAAVPSRKARRARQVPRCCRGGRACHESRCCSSACSIQLLPGEPGAEQPESGPAATEADEMLAMAAVELADVLPSIVAGLVRVESFQQALHRWRDTIVAQAAACLDRATAQHSRLFAAARAEANRCGPLPPPMSACKHIPSLSNGRAGEPWRRGKAAQHRQRARRGPVLPRLRSRWARTCPSRSRVSATARDARIGLQGVRWPGDAHCHARLQGLPLFALGKGPALVTADRGPKSPRRPREDAMVLLAARGHRKVPPPPSNRSSSRRCPRMDKRRGISASSCRSWAQ